MRLKFCETPEDNVSSRVLIPEGRRPEGINTLLETLSEGVSQNWSRIIRRSTTCIEGFNLVNNFNLIHKERHGIANLPKLRAWINIPNPGRQKLSKMSHPRISQNFVISRQHVIEMRVQLYIFKIFHFYRDNLVFVSICISRAEFCQLLFISIVVLLVIFIPFI